jgi:hypothetical protein
MHCNKKRLRQFAATAFVLSMLVASGRAQQANVGVPFGQTSTGFFEQSGVGFGFGGPNLFFRQDSFNLAIPQFGGFDPGAGATFGFGVPVGNGQASFNFAFGQGSRSSATVSAPSVTIPNGGFGGFSAGSWTPFVAGAVPVVGDAPGGMPFGATGSTSLLAERLSRLPHEAPSTVAPDGRSSQVWESANQSGDLFQQNLAKAIATSGGDTVASVAQIEQFRAQRQAAAEQSTQREIDRFVARGEAAIQAGKPHVARIYFQQAAQRAEGPLKAELIARIQALKNPPAK